MLNAVDIEWAIHAVMFYNGEIPILQLAQIIVICKITVWLFSSCTEFKTMTTFVLNTCIDDLKMKYQYMQRAPG